MVQKNSPKEVENTMGCNGQEKDQYQSQLTQVLNIQGKDNRQDIRAQYYCVTPNIGNQGEVKYIGSEERRVEEKSCQQFH